MTKRILLADDSLTIQKVVELTFSDSDYDLVCVANGQRALESVRENPPDLILADVVMPEKNGYEVCEAIKGDPATSRIPVVLLSGTFEPFDRQRAETIGADAIVSKPFDSQQLLAQVDALLDRIEDRRQGEERAPAPAQGPPRATAEPEPFDAGFSAEDFTAAIRRPPEGLDPFEEEYGRGDVDSAIEAFEKSRPELISGSGPAAVPDEPTPAELPHQRDTAEPSPDWFADEPEKPAPDEMEAAAPEERDEAAPAAEAAERTLAAENDEDRTIGVGLPPPEPPDLFERRADEGPTQEIPHLREARAETSKEEAPFPESSDESAETLPEAEEISAADAAALFDLPETPPEPPAESAPEREAVVAAVPVEATAADPAERRDAEPAEVPSEIEMLASRASIPELTQMLSSVAKNGNELTDEQIERLAQRVVEKLSDRVLREIAWEVIPEMAEIVIKKRIKELEAGIE